MAIKPLKKSWGSNKTINYVGKDFGQLKQNLIDFTKTYFPNTYSDFSEASPGMVFVEMAAYIGDVLSFYQDTQLKESMLMHATERKNIIALAQAMGYKPRISTPAVTNLTVWQLVPATGTGDTNKPDETYYLKIKSGLEVTAKSNSGVIFRTVDSVDFSNPNGREITVYSRNSTTGETDFYLISKKVQAISATEVQTTLTIPNFETDYPVVTLNDTSIIEITSITEQITKIGRAHV